MEQRWKIIIGTLGTVAILLLLFGGRLFPTSRGIADETRRQLREKGFKTDLSDFDFSAPTDVRTRCAALTNQIVLNAPGNSRRSVISQSAFLNPNVLAFSETARFVWS